MAGGRMVQRVSTVAFEGIEARAVDVQVQVAPGLPAFTIVSRQWQKMGPIRLTGPLFVECGRADFKKCGLKPLVVVGLAARVCSPRPELH